MHDCIHTPEQGHTAIERRNAFLAAYPTQDDTPTSKLGEREEHLMRAGQARHKLTDWGHDLVPRGQCTTCAAAS